MEKYYKKKTEKNIDRKKNQIISSVGLIILFVILFFALINFMISGANKGYISNSNPLYEYSGIIYIVVWYFSKDLKINNLLLKIYPFLYGAQSFYFGDRSAAFLVIIVFFLLNINNVSIPKVTTLALLAIIVSNIVATLRSTRSFDINYLIEQLVQSGLYSDTASFSYYASITIVASPWIIGLSIRYQFIKDFLISIIIGAGNTKTSNLAVYLTNNYPELLSRGGGFMSSFFYAYAGYIGVIIGAVIVGVILYYIFSNDGEFAYLYQILIVAYSLRWYLYHPIPLFRTILLNFTLLFLVSLFFHNAMVKNKNNK